MKKISVLLLTSVLFLGGGNPSVFANSEGNIEVNSQTTTKSLSTAEKASILKAVASPHLDILVSNKDGSIVNSLNYILQNADTGEIINKGETKDGKINSKITIGKMIQEAANKKGEEVNYTDFVLRVYNNTEEVYASYYFSVPVFKNASSFINNVDEKELIDLLWIHNSNFKDNSNSEILSAAGYEKVNEGLTLTLNTKDDSSSDVTSNQDFNVSASCSLKSTSNGKTAMGRITGNQNLSSKFTIQSGADLKIDTGLNGAISGSVTRNISSTYTTPHAPTTASSRIVYGTFSYGKYSCQDRYVYPYFWEEVRPISFIVPDGSSVVYGIDGKTPSGNIGSLTGGQTYTQYVSNGYRFSAGTTVHGMTLGTEVAYSSSHSYSFTAKGKGSKIFDNGSLKKVWYSTPIQ